MLTGSRTCRVAAPSVHGVAPHQFATSIYINCRRVIGMAGSIPPDRNEVTRILSAIELGEPQAACQLLPLVYDELRA